MHRYEQTGNFADDVVLFMHYCLLMNNWLLHVAGFLSAGNIQRNL